ncbi:hypothetical protein LZC95_52670 [Pendulispora brunnea]|uniref:Coenzyme PQQ synthesis protein A n=1 Tax=Pendulispora brunnea TaxID=2905690 RepID=A0ABZ2KBY0_9BACT
MTTSTSVTWEKPTAIEIKMDAEISSYQEEDPWREGPPVCEPQAES